MSTIDLHIHSNYSSDGEFSVGEILAQCKANGIQIMSITDHNSVRGVAEALAESGGICFIPGVELDCTYKGRLFHLLGYGIDHTRDEFPEIEQNLLNQERNAAVEKIHLFRNATGIPVDLHKIMDSAKHGIVTGELIGEYVLAQENAPDFEVLRPYLPGGEKSDMPNAWFYWDFFAPGKPAYVPIQTISLSDARELIRKGNGISVLAHPGQSLSGDYSLLAGIIQEDIDGIEVFSSYHSAETAAYFLAVAKQNGLLITPGSDFHGKNKPAIQLGGHGAFLNDDELVKGIGLDKWYNNV